MSEEIDGSNWVSLVTDTIEQERTITPVTKIRIKNALTAELITQSQRQSIMEHIDISFPPMDNGDPSVRIFMDPKAPEQDRRFLDNFIFEKTENYLTPTSKEFLELKKPLGISVLKNGGYYAGTDTIIRTSSAENLAAAISTMITNPLIKMAFNQPSGIIKKS